MFKISSLDSSSGKGIDLYLDHLHRRRVQEGDRFRLHFCAGEEKGKFKDLFFEKKSLIYGFCIQLLLLPLIGILVSELFNTSLFAIAAVIVLIVPGGHVSGLLSHIKNGNVPLSVFLTSFASMISPLTIIFWLTVVTSRSVSYTHLTLPTKA